MAGNIISKTDFSRPLIINQRRDNSVNIYVTVVTKLFVMKPALKNMKAIFAHSVNKPVLIRDATAPASGKIPFQGFG
ncbi:MAG TPA: hypothetical protein VK625_21820, partial [Flavitalea sp.]|nr:hypothetical protein [Flavitalea sp.]